MAHQVDIEVFKDKSVHVPPAEIHQPDEEDAGNRQNHIRPRLRARYQRQRGIDEPRRRQRGNNRYHADDHIHQQAHPQRNRGAGDDQRNHIKQRILFGLEFHAVSSLSNIHSKFYLYQSPDCSCFTVSLLMSIQIPANIAKVPGKVRIKKPPNFHPAAAKQSRSISCPYYTPVQAHRKRNCASE